MSFAAFGPGSLYLTRTDVATSTPVNIGFAQDLTIDISFNSKELYGQNQFPLQVARSVAKVTGKAKAAQISGIALNSAFFGNSFATGTVRSSLGEGPTTVPGTPFQITVTNNATFDVDLGVINATTGLPLAKVANSPSTGQYSVSSGIYTFATADAGISVSISYTYLVSGGTLQKLAIDQQIIGFTPTFQMDYATTNLSKNLVVRAFSCIGTKLAFNFKLEDFMIPELDFGIFANSGGHVFLIGFPEVS